MKNYAVVGSNASGSSNKTLIGLSASSATLLTRAAIYDIIIGNSQSPVVSQQANFKVGRFTAIGTPGATPTPLPLDSNDQVALTVAGTAHSAEPTYTAGGTLLSISMNQQATWRWIANPGSELRVPLTNVNGIGLFLSAVNAAAIFDSTCLFSE